MWLNGSDETPIPSVETEALAVLKERDWHNPVLSAAADRKSTITGATGVKMSGPYDYVPPEYWYLDKEKVGAFGFNTETSPGPAIPELRAFVTHYRRPAGGPSMSSGTFTPGSASSRSLAFSTRPWGRTYGPAKDLDDYQRKAQRWPMTASARCSRPTAQQVHVDRRDPVDAEQRLAVVHLAFV